MAQKLAFTKTSLGKLIEQNAGRRVVVHDDRQPGLIAELREGGSLSFFLYRWHDGRPHRIRLGAFRDMTVEQARDRARKLIADQVDGKDPAAIKRARREEATLKDLFNHWMEKYAKPHKRTWQEDQRQYDKLLAHWKSRKLSSITEDEVSSLHLRIGRKHGHYAANRLLSLLRAMFNKAKGVGFAGPNPTHGIKRFHEEKRDRFLLPEEVPAFFTALAAEPQDFQDFFMLALLTGARRGNVCSMAWVDVHLDGAAWRIPDSKNKEPILVHLPAKALEILRRRQDEIEADEKRCGSPWVFPGGKKNRAGHLIDPKLSWDRVRKAAGMPDLRMHDLRRTLGSWQAIAGVSLPIIGKSLGHKSLQSTAIYARLTNAPVAESVTKATDAILAAAKPTT